MVKRITGENSSECTAHAGAVFYKFFEVAAAPHRAAPQLSMKNMRELK